MYVVRTRVTELADKRYFSTDYLMTMTAKELREAEAALRPDDGVEYNIVTAEMARRYVKDGMCHMTAYWVDGNVVRYASDGI